MVGDEALVELAYPEYWDNRYTLERKILKDDTQPILDSYEWFRGFETLRPFLTKHLPPPSTACRILHLGCGNSVILTSLLYSSLCKQIRGLITSAQL
jgi:EEF1A lysine methyltransferase 4